MVPEDYDCLGVGIDLSAGLSEKNDWTVMTLGGIKDGKIYLNKCMGHSRGTHYITAEVYGYVEGTPAQVKKFEADAAAAKALEAARLAHGIVFVEKPQNIRTTCSSNAVKADLAVPTNIPSGATAHVVGTSLNPGSSTVGLTITEQSTTLSLVVTAQDGVSTSTYALVITCGHCSADFVQVDDDTGGGSAISSGGQDDGSLTFLGSSF